MELHQDLVKTDNFTLAQRSLKEWHRQLGHMNFRSIIRFARLFPITSILKTSKERHSYMFSMLFWEKNCTSPNKNGSGAGITDEDNQQFICISID